MLQACETDVTFVLKLILQTQGEYVVFPVLFISLYEIALFIEVELVIGLHADMLVETYKAPMPSVLWARSVLEVKLFSTPISFPFNLVLGS